jgi:hypothetical protein
MPAPQSLRSPPQVGVNSNVGRVTTKGQPQIIYGRKPNMPVQAPLVPQLTALAASLNQSIAPVCPITRGEAPPTQPGIKVPVVPRPTDLTSVINAVNQIIDFLSDVAQPTIRWLEKSRTTTIVRITNPSDENQWVEVERIQTLTMEDQITGDLWYWELGPPAPPAPITISGGSFSQIFYGLTGTVVNPPRTGGGMPQPIG